MTDMTRMLDSMENALKMQFQASTERRADKAEQEKQAFQEKLTRAAMSKLELDGIASKLKGSEDAVRRDQLIAFLMAGF